MAKVGVLGTTSWGTTLAILTARNGHDVTLWARTESEATALDSARANTRFLADARFPDNLSVTASRDEAFADSDLVLIAVPSRTLRENVRSLAASLSDSAVVVSATKGIEIDSGKRMSQVLENELPRALRSTICALSGPNLASEIIEGKPSATLVASSNVTAAERAQSILTSSSFRVYTNPDIVGVELAGSLKNIIALGAGVIDGLGYGDNTKAAFMTRGLAEIARLAVGAGADPMTLSGLAGMGDLIATCSSKLSRNHFVGEQLASGKSLERIRAGMKNVAEGIDATAAAVKLSERMGVEMPIAAATYGVLFDGVPILQAVADLLGRAPSPE